MSSVIEERRRALGQTGTWTVSRINEQKAGSEVERRRHSNELRESGKGGLKKAERVGASKAI